MTFQEMHDDFIYQTELLMLNLKKEIADSFNRYDENVKKIFSEYNKNLENISNEIDRLNNSVNKLHKITHDEILSGADIDQ